MPEKPIEHILPANAQLLQSILDASPNTIQALNAVRNKSGQIIDFEWIYFNKQAQNGAVIGARLLDNHSVHVDKSLFGKYKNVVDTGAPAQFEWTVPVNETEKWYTVSVVKMGDGIIVTSQDITAERQADMPPGEQTKFIKNIAAAIPAVINVYDFELDRHIYINREMNSLIGIPTETIRKKEFTEILEMIHPEDRESVSSFFEDIKKARDDEMIYRRYRLMNAKGEWLWFEARSTVFKRDEHGAVIQYISISEDITEKKEAADQLKANQHFIEQVMNTTPDFIYVLDLDIKSIVFVTKHAVEMFGMAAKDIYEAGPGIFKLLVHPDDLQKKMEHVASMTRLKQDDIKELEVRLRTRTGEYRWFCVRDTIFKTNESGDVQQTIGIGTDIHLQKIAERMLNDKNRELELLNAELKTFNSLAVHEFKETFRKVYTSMEFVVTHDARRLTDEGKANIRRVQASIQKLKLLTDDIETYARINTFDVQVGPVDAGAVLQEVLDHLKEPLLNANAQVEVMSLPEMPADPALLASLFHNLIDNAIKFRKLAVPTLIQIRYATADEINYDPKATRDTPYGIITVSDNGIGFDQEESEKIFEMFFKLHDKKIYRGSGIGLSICRKIMTLHQGFIRAEGVKAHGASIHCYFPLERT